MDVGYMAQDCILKDVYFLHPLGQKYSSNIFDNVCRDHKSAANDNSITRNFHFTRKLKKQNR